MTDRRHVVVCVGNRFRRDDSVGLHVAARLRELVPDGVEVLTLEGEPTTLLDIFDGSELVILVDAVAAAAPPGVIHRFDATDEPVPGSVFGTSSHAIGLGETIELARTLGRLHGRVVVYGITGEDFDAGEGLSPGVASAANAVAVRILGDLAVSSQQAAKAKGADRA